RGDVVRGQDREARLHRETLLRLLLGGETRSEQHAARGLVPAAKAVARDERLGRRDVVASAPLELAARRPNDPDHPIAQALAGPSYAFFEARWSFLTVVGHRRRRRRRGGRARP